MLIEIGEEEDRKREKTYFFVIGYYTKIQRIELQHTVLII